MGIVGKTGSGKTAILKLLLESLKDIKEASSMEANQSINTNSNV